MAAMQQACSEGSNDAMLRLSQGNKVWQCLEKPIGFTNGTPLNVGSNNHVRALEQ